MFWLFWIKINEYFGGFFCILKKICFVEIQTGKNFGGKIGEFVKTRFVKLSDEPIINSFLKCIFAFFFKADSSERIRNFGKDIKNSTAYIHLIKQIAPEDAFVDKSALQTEGTSISFILFFLFLPQFYPEVVF